ncbi:MAG: NAD(P)/FAD-dependent oxidoreductase [Candidatus Micrarchaeia archaeon]
MFDVHVVGAGPAGCAAAAAACAQGARVLLSEEHAHIGQPERCSGLVSKTGLDSFGFDYSEAILNRINGARCHSPSGNVIELKFSETMAFVISRATFDLLCAEEAEKEGAKLELGRRVRRGDLSGKSIIGADGLASVVAEWFGFPPITRFVTCWQADFERVKVGEPHTVEVFLSHKFAPGFFAWLIPLNEESARLGLGVCPPANSKKCFDVFLRQPRIASLIKNARPVSHFAYSIPLSVRRKTGKGRVFLVGNAAGQVKATTGGGVFFGGACGRIAGKIAAEGKSGEEYEAAWRAEYGDDLVLHERAREFYNSLSEAQLEQYFSLAKLLQADRFLSTFGHMDRPTLMLPHLALFPPLRAACSLFAPIAGSVGHA